MIGSFRNLRSVYYLDWVRGIGYWICIAACNPAPEIWFWEGMFREVCSEQWAVCSVQCVVCSVQCAVCIQMFSGKIHKLTTTSHYFISLHFPFPSVRDLWRMRIDEIKWKQPARSDLPTSCEVTLNVTWFLWNHLQHPVFGSVINIQGLNNNEWMVDTVEWSLCVAWHDMVWTIRSTIYVWTRKRRIEATFAV